MSVDLPDPDGPMTAVNLAALEGHVDTGESLDGRLAGPVGLSQIDRLRRRGRLQVFV